MWALQDAQVGYRDIVLDSEGLYVVASKVTQTSSTAVVQHISFDGDVLWTVELGGDTGGGGS